MNNDLLNTLDDNFWCPPLVFYSDMAQAFFRRNFLELSLDYFYNHKRAHIEFLCHQQKNRDKRFINKHYIFMVASFLSYEMYKADKILSKKIRNSQKIPLHDPDHFCPEDYSFDNRGEEKTREKIEEMYKKFRKPIKIKRIKLLLPEFGGEKESEDEAYLRMFRAYREEDFPAIFRGFMYNNEYIITHYKKEFYKNIIYKRYIIIE